MKISNFFKAVIENIMPDGMTLTMTITFFVNILTIFLYYYEMPISLSNEMIKNIEIIFNVSILNFLFKFLLVLSFVFVIVLVLSEKTKLNIYIYNLEHMTEAYLRGFLLYVSCFFLIKIAMKELGTVMKGNNVLAICLIIMVFYFIFLIRSFFVKEKDDNCEYNSYKRKYLSDIMLEYYDRPIQDIEKRIALCRLYRETKELFEMGYKFEDIELLKRRKEMEQEREQDDRYRKMNDYLNDKNKEW